MTPIKLFPLGILFLFYSCNQPGPGPDAPGNNGLVSYPVIGNLEIIDNDILQVVDSSAAFEIISEGYEWSEGPLWLEKIQTLIWSDVPGNTIYQWSEKQGVSIYLTPSGSTGNAERTGEPGSNGLTLDRSGSLVLCQHGDRRLARMNSEIDDPSPDFETIAAKFEGKRFNSPNDVAIGPDAGFYFTDPPYGLEKQEMDPAKEISFQGVYKVNAAGEVVLQTSELSRPNGIAFNADKTKCYVANSDPEKAIWMVYDLDASNNLTNGKVFFDATAMVPGNKGLPDGLKVNKKGILFASGPGGVLVFSPEGKHLGTISTGQAISNCALNTDESILYLTSDMYIVRVRLL